MNAGRVWGNVIFFRGIKVILSEVPFTGQVRDCFGAFWGESETKKKKKKFFKVI